MSNVEKQKKEVILLLFLLILLLFLLILLVFLVILLLFLVISGKGLRHFSMKVCEKVQAKGSTSYNEVADELVNELTDPR